MHSPRKTLVWPARISHSVRIVDMDWPRSHHLPIDPGEGSDHLHRAGGQDRIIRIRSTLSERPFIPPIVSGIRSDLINTPYPRCLGVVILTGLTLAKLFLPRS